jgi:hypothetical protein
MFEAPRQIQSAAAGGANVAIDLPTEGGIDVRRMLAALWRGKTTILLTTLASLLAAPGHVLKCRTMQLPCIKDRPVADDPAL